MVGPLIAAIGFALFYVPTVGDSYWKSFFPAIMVLGFGMAVTVAPLTTVVMNSVKEDSAGTASGINNTVARVAGALAIAVLGIVMVKAFSFRLDRGLAGLSLPSYIRQEVQANEIKLAGLQLPAGLDPTANAAIQESVREAFVYGFRIVMSICAGLSLASAAVAWLMIPPEHDRPRLPADSSS
jgi:predicted MFS family arabinose efflux permease